MSLVPPGGKGVISLMEWLGYADCANSGNDELAPKSINPQSNARRDVKTELMNKTCLLCFFANYNLVVLLQNASLINTKLGHL
jgi:hypothetical protein